ncbi:MAG: hypothetical protein FJW66_01610 [Actinobacteria bacterium]|nr:hypothetical protein [Actinomycetota bacterium]
MKTSGRKYFILAIAGAAIIGFGIFMLLNVYFEKTEIIIAKKDISKNEKITEDNIASAQYFKNSLPAGYIAEKNEVLGKTVNIERKAGDPITRSVFEQNTEPGAGILQDLKEGEVMMALSLAGSEPLADEITRGCRICIVSTEKEKEYDMQFYAQDSKDGVSSYPRNLIDSESFSISENILVVDGQVIIKNLEVISTGRSAGQKTQTLIPGNNEITYVYLKCNIKEAPAISRITKDDEYKIFLEKS